MMGEQGVSRRENCEVQLKLTWKTSIPVNPNAETKLQGVEVARKPGERRDELFP